MAKPAGCNHSAAMGVGAALALLLGAPDAGARPELPRAYEILLGPKDWSHILLQLNVMGVIRTVDGGESWDYICSNAWGGRYISQQRHPMLLLEGGRLLVAARFAGLQIADDPCSFAPHPHWERQSGSDGQSVVQDVRLGTDGETPYVLTMRWDDGELDGRLWRSDDRGDTWTQAGEPLPGEIGATQLAFAPSDPSRIYVAGKRLDDAENGVVLRSSDGGRSWKITTVPVGNPASWTARIHAVHPRNADVVFFWMDREGRATGRLEWDELWHSNDGGENWERVFAAAGDLPGFTFSPDASVVLIAGEHDGIWRAAPEAIAERGRDAFSRVFEGRVFGLNWTEAGLYAGHDDFAPQETERFMLGVSGDGGEAFEPMLEMCNVRPIECPADSPTARLCELAFSTPGGFVDQYPEGPRCVPEEDGDDGDAPANGGPSPGGDPRSPAQVEPVADPATGREGARCSCDLPARRSPSAMDALALLLVAAIGRRHSKNRRGANRSPHRGPFELGARRADPVAMTHGGS